LKQQKVILKQFLMVINPENTDKKNGTVWVCLNENKEKCKGRMRIKNIEIINFSDDLCKPDVATSEVKKQFHNAKKKECEKTEESSYTESEIFR